MVTTRRKSTTPDSLQNESENFSEEKELDTPEGVGEVQVVEEVKVQETPPILLEDISSSSNSDLVPSKPEPKPEPELKVVSKPPVLELKAPPKRHQRNIPKFSNFK